MFLKGPLQSSHVRGVQDCCSHAHFGQDSLDELASAPVAVCCSDDVASSRY